MAKLSIDAPAMGGKTVKITGKRVGLFLVHKTDDVALYGLKDIPLFRVTLISTGNQFPWDFASEEAAAAFAADIADVMDWSAVKTEFPAAASSSVVSWTVGKPTKKQNVLIMKAAAQRGGVRS